MNSKIEEIKRYIGKHKNVDGDFWLNEGNDFLYEILDSFDKADWEILNINLIKFYDYEHSIFSRAILYYDTFKFNNIDNYEIFFKEFILMKDYEDCDCLLQNVMYVSKIRKPNIELLNNIKNKIKFLEDFGYSVNQDILKFAYENIEKVISENFG